MRVGVPKEVKVHEYRVGLVPASARELIAHGHQVFVQAGAAERMGIADDDYRRVGATILADAAEVFDVADMVVKVKEPLAAERAMLRQGQTLFTYLHLAPDPHQAKDLLRSGVTAIAYETVTGRARRTAAAVADERGGRAHVDPGRRALPGDGAGRTRHAARRLRRRRTGQRRRHRRRRVGRQRRAHGHRAGGGGHLHRHQHRAAVRARPAVRRLGQHHLLDAAGDRGLRAAGRSRRRRGAGPRRGGAQADHREAGQSR